MIIAGHNHYMTEKDFAKHLFGWNIVPIITSDKGDFVTTKILRFLKKVTRNEKFDRMANMVRIADMSTEEIFLKQKAYYPTNTIFVAIAIDMRFMERGSVPRDYLMQLDDLAELSKMYNVIPVFHADPRNPNLMTEFHLAIKMGFKGVKLYPAMGYRPDDERLTPIYEYCNQHGMFVIAHAGEESPTHLGGSKKKIKQALEQADVPYTDDMDKKALCGQFGHPRYYIPLALRYSNIQFILAHMGSNKAVEQHIKDKTGLFREIKTAMEICKNINTDCSYVMTDRSFWSWFKLFLLDNPVLAEQVIFGSDYYMNQMEASESIWSRDFRVFLGERLFNLIAKNNSKRVFNL